MADYERWTITVPQPIADQVALALWDPILLKPGYGERARLIEQLLLMWLTKQTQHPSDPNGERHVKQVVLSSGIHPFEISPEGVAFNGLELALGDLKTLVIEFERSMRTIDQLQRRAKKE